MTKAVDPYLVTPDGRYFVVRGRLWRTSNPGWIPKPGRLWWRG